MLTKFTTAEDGLDRGHGNTARRHTTIHDEMAGGSLNPCQRLRAYRPNTGWVHSEGFGQGRSLGVCHLDACFPGGGEGDHELQRCPDACFHPLEISSEEEVAEDAVFLA